MSGSGMRFGLIVHHTDAERDTLTIANRTSGKLDLALDAAAINQ